MTEHNETEEVENIETETPDKADKTKPEKTFTQAQFDAGISARLKREKEKQTELEAKLGRLEALEAAEEERKQEAMTEQERLQSEKEAANKRAEEAEGKAQTTLDAANKRIIDSELRAIARSLDANDVTDVLALIDKTSIVIEDDGSVAGVEELVSAMKADKPWLFKRAIGADASGGSNPSKTPSVDELTAKETELAELKKAATLDRRLLGGVTKLANEIRQLRTRK